MGAVLVSPRLVATVEVSASSDSDPEDDEMEVGVEERAGAVNEVLMALKCGGLWCGGPL